MPLASQNGVITPALNSCAPSRSSALNPGTKIPGRGHGVFDTATIVDGSMYGLEAHFNRFLWSADRAAIQLPMSPDQMVRTILETAAASNAANGGQWRFHTQQSCCDERSCALLAPRLQRLSTSLVSPSSNSKVHPCMSVGHVRYWLSPGRGGFGLSPRECDFPTFYVVVYKDDRPPLNPVQGWKVRAGPLRVCIIGWICCAPQPAEKAKPMPLRPK